MSISFVTLEPRFRIPEYIALRFNLKITHVYRGMLAGTGPLVDPGYDNYLCLPIHNLTNNDYVLRGGDPLVWIEFTKLTPRSKDNATDSMVTAIDREFERKNHLADLEDYLTKADAHRPIQSSIPISVRHAEITANQALNTSAATQRMLLTISIAGLAGIVLATAAIIIGAVYPVVGLLKDVNALLLTSSEKISELRQSSDSMKAELAQLKDNLARAQQVRPDNVASKPKAVQGARPQ
jgi:hypothetical protein